MQKSKEKLLAELAYALDVAVYVGDTAGAAELNRKINSIRAKSAASPCRCANLQRKATTMPRYLPAQPKAPVKPGGWWLSCMIDTQSGREIPTGAIHSTKIGAEEYAIETAQSWNAKISKSNSRHWWQFWK